MQTSVVDTIFKKKNQKNLLISFPHSLIQSFAPITFISVLHLLHSSVPPIHTHTETALVLVPSAPHVAASVHILSLPLHLGTAARPLLLVPFLCLASWTPSSRFSSHLTVPSFFFLGYLFLLPPCSSAQSLDLSSIHTQPLRGHQRSHDFKYCLDAEDTSPQFQTLLSPKPPWYFCLDVQSTP